MKEPALTAAGPGVCHGSSPAGGSSRSPVLASRHTAGKQRLTGLNSGPRFSRAWPSARKPRRSAPAL